VHELLLCCSGHGVGNAEFYTDQDSLTDPGAFAGLYDDLPGSPAELRDVVSRLITHVAWATQYCISQGTPMRDTLPVADRLQLSQTLMAGSLEAERSADKRSFGTCRDYALVLCSMFRHRSIPARVRCGFATYFTAGPYEDHWICEYWSAGAMRWGRADAQLDALHREQLAIAFDCADLPADAFLTAGQAWKLARSGIVAPQAFGNGNARGLWFLRVNVYRDLLALTNQSMSAWDTWRNSTEQSKVLSPRACAAVDELVEVIEAIDVGSNQIATLKVIASKSQVPLWQS
jgi:Transglutaminase-like superfamily